MEDLISKIVMQRHQAALNTYRDPGFISFLLVAGGETTDKGIANM